MGVVKKDGFNFFDGLLSDYILIDEDKLDEYINYINKKSIKHVCVMDGMGYNLENVNFLDQCSKVEFLRLISPFIKDFSGVYNLIHLKKLSLDIPKGEIDLERLKSLKQFTTIWNKNVKNLDKCTQLEKLGITNYKSKLNNLEELSFLSELKEFILIKSTITSFKGLGNLKQLEKLDFSYLRNLEYIDELDKISGNLKHLRFDGCKKIKNHEYVTKLKELELLSFDNCGDIPSIHFIKKLSKLKKFIFVESNIVDGDLSPCIGLEYVGFLDKRHYSHKVKDFKK